MAFTTIPMNLTAMQEITPPNISLTGSNVFSTIISDANSYTNDLLIFGSMFIILVLVYIVLSDKTPLQDFGYGDIRALNIALAVSVIIGLNIVMVGWSENFFAVGMFISFWLVTYIGITIYENKG